MMIIWGRLSSMNVQKVVLAAELFELSYDRREAGMAYGVVNTPDYRAMNPNGLVPVLQDEGHVLWESNAIVRYLAARYATGSWWPENPGERALCDRWTDWQATELAPAMGPAFMQLVRTPPEKRDMAAVEASRVRVERLMSILDAHLEGRVELEGGRLSFADIILMPAVHRWLNMPLERESRPNVEGWYQRIAGMEAAKIALPLPLV